MLMPIINYTQRAQMGELSVELISFRFFLNFFAIFLDFVCVHFEFGFLLREESSRDYESRVQDVQCTLLSSLC